MCLDCENGLVYIERVGVVSDGAGYESKVNLGCRKHKPTTNMFLVQRLVLLLE